MSSNTRWEPPANQTLGPPKPTKQRFYSPYLQDLETKANINCTRDYEQEILNHLSSIESNSRINYAMFDLQPEVKWFMRSYVLDYLLEVHESFRLNSQTLFLAFNIIDKYGSKRVIFKRHYQLVGCTALWLAAKYEDKKSRVPTLKELTLMCKNAYDPEMFVQMERHILESLNWSLSFTSLEDCLQISLKNSFNLLRPNDFNNNNNDISDFKTQLSELSRFFCELSIYDRLIVQFPSSLISIASHLLASNILNSTLALNSLQLSIEKIQFNNNYNYNYNFNNGYDEDIENILPDVTQPFLSGFSNDTIDNIRIITILLINSVNDCSKSLENKYRKPFKNVNFSNIETDYIELVSRFMVKNQYLINQLPSNDSFSPDDIEKIEIDSLMYSITDILLGFNKVQQAAVPPSTPTNSIVSSIFSNEFQLPPPPAPFTSSSVYSSSPVNSMTPSTSPIDNESVNSLNKNKRNRDYYDETNNSSPLAQRSQNRLNIV